MKPFLISLIYFIGLVIGTAQQNDPYRTFRDTEGRAIKAVLVSATAEEVWIRREDSQTFRVKSASFSPADQKFIAAWRVAEALKAPQALQFSVRRFSAGRELTTTTTRRITTEQYGYAVTLTNSTPFDLENLEVEYRYFALRSSANATGQDRKRQRFSGLTRIDRLASLTQTEFLTAPIPIVSSSLRSDRSGTQRRATDDLGGIWIRVRSGPDTVAEFSSPNNLKETENW
jgi:hypothetical protein